MYLFQNGPCPWFLTSLSLSLSLSLILQFKLLSMSLWVSAWKRGCNAARRQKPSKQLLKLSNGLANAVARVCFCILQMNWAEKSLHRIWTWFWRQLFPSCTTFILAWHFYCRLSQEPQLSTANSCCNVLLAIQAFAASELITCKKQLRKVNMKWW